MEPIKDLAELETTRASILSNQKFHRDRAEQNAPPDKTFLVHFFFFCLGLTSFMSMSFFLTANDYWMYKFKDISQTSYNASNKTTLQAYFASYTSIAQAVPSLITAWVATLLGHKINIRYRILVPLCVLVLIYCVFTAFIKINTDLWQTAFFAITMIGYIILSVASTILQLAIFGLVAKFPPIYFKMNMYGQGTSGLFSAILQIISLAIGGETTSSAMIYFICGTSAIVVTLFLTYFILKHPRVIFYLGDTVADQDRKIHTLQEMKGVAYQIWPCLFMLYSMLLVMGTGHPNITTLVVSENYGKGHVWNDKYFVPVVTYMSSEIYNLAGRWLGLPIVKGKFVIPIIIAHTTRLVIFTPVFMLCNTNPKEHLPLLFPHDWEYILLLALNGLGASFFMTCAFLSLPTLAKEKTELGFMLMQSLAQPLQTALSFLSPLYVKLL